VKRRRESQPRDPGQEMARSRAFQKFNRRKRSCDGLKDPLSARSGPPHGEAVRRMADRIDLIRCRAELLTGRDRALVQMYLDNTGTFRQMARVAGVNEANVARRIHKIIRRLLDGQFITCLHYREKFTQEQIEMARDYFVDGLSMREIAYRHETSYYEVRRTMKQIQRLTAVHPMR
jgi:predicted DNA-binding protein YlxM (UPF0122 family)